MANIQIRNLTFTYPHRDRPTLDNICLTVPQGQYLAVCGQSGSGKTTLLRHLKSVLTPHGDRQGQVLLDGVTLESLEKYQQAARIGFVMQDPDDQLVTDKVWHELAFGMENLGCSHSQMQSRLAEMASYFGIQQWLHRDVNTLSGGQKQLLNLAAVMVMQPDVLILDEPTSQLDPLAATDFLNTVRRINQDLGVTVIITEHRLEEILPVADRVIVMDSGKITADGDPKTVGQTLWQRKDPMFPAMPAPVRVFCYSGGEEECPLTVRQGRSWLENQVSKPVKVQELPQKALDNPNAALKIKDLWFRYERTAPDVLKGVTMQIPAGELTAIVGGNGGGKSTLLRAICGVHKPYRGKILRDKNAGVSMLPQDPKSLFVRSTVRDELQEMTADQAQIDEMAKLCSVEDLLERHPYDISGGEQQRAALAKVLLTKPQILLLDEPTKGIDTFYKETFADILCKLKDQGVTILMVSHDVEFCARFADRVGMLFDGELLALRSPEDFFGGNSFYTTAANRMSRGLFRNAVTARAVARLVEENR